MIHVFGELALHVFHPTEDSTMISIREVSESPVQLGGSAALAARSLSARGYPAILHGSVGMTRLDV